MAKLPYYNIEEFGENPSPLNYTLLKGKYKMRNSPRLNRYERREMHAEKLKNDMSGTGVYIYENNTDGDLKLPKPTDSGVRQISPKNKSGCRFQGDSYYLQWVGSPMNLLKLVEEVVPKMTHTELMEHRAKQEQLLEEEAMANEQLLLDQPDCITHQGKIERVIIEPEQKSINDNTENSQKKPVEVLLTEDPLDGVEIILG